MDKGRIEIGFLGYGTRALDCLMEHPLFVVKYFFAPRSRLCREVYDAQGRYDREMKMEIIEDKEHLAKRFAEIADVDCFLMNACPIILDGRALSEMKVFNIHPGDLRYNRGHQPHCWTVLLGERQTKIVLHRVSEEIDSGFVVKSAGIRVDCGDSAEDVLNHAEDKIPVLLDALYRHIAEHTDFETVVNGGTYRKIMSPEDYEIRLETDTREQMERKILSRSMHHGAFFRYGRKKIYVDMLLSCCERGEKQSLVTRRIVDSQNVDWRPDNADWAEVRKQSGDSVFVRVEEEKKLVYIDSPRRNLVFRLNRIVI